MVVNELTSWLDFTSTTLVTLLVASCNEAETLVPAASSFLVTSSPWAVSCWAICEPRWESLLSTAVPAAFTASVILPPLALSVFAIVDVALARDLVA